MFGMQWHMQYDLSPPKFHTIQNLVDVSDIFIFFLLGGGERGVRGAGRGGGRFFIENPRRGGLPGGWGRGARGAGRVFAGNVGGGGAKYFFSGRNSHQENVYRPT